jgi:hypothetical protein
MSVTDPAAGADGISAGDPPVDAAKDTPTIPSTDTALLGRFAFEARLACGIAGSLLTSFEQTREPIAPVGLFNRY